MPSFPSLPIANMSMRSINPTRVTTTINGLEQRSSLSAQYYQLTVNFENLTQSDQRQLLAFIDEMRGPLTAFDITLPDYLGDRTGAVYSIAVRTTTSAGATSVPITASGAPNGSIVLKAGDLIRFSNHNKVYSVASNVSITSTNGTITLTTPLRSGVTATTHTVTADNVSMSVRFTNDINEFQIGADLYPSFSIELQEVLT